MLINYVLCTSRRQLNMQPDSYVRDLFNEVQKINPHLEQILNDSAFYVICNGKRLGRGTVLEDSKTYHLVPRLVGGKGGFGSMLRAIGAQIEKTTSREACRDLSGRRMRDINNEKKLKEWLAKEAEREQEREERKKDRLAKHLRPQHKFDDEDYHEQKAKVQEDLQDALNTGLKRKMKNGENGASSQDKKLRTDGKASKAEWLGMDLDSDDLCSSDSDMEANPGDDPSISSQSRAGDHERLGSPQKEGETDLKQSEEKSLPALDKVQSESPSPSHGLLASLPKPVQSEEGTLAKTEPPVDTPSDIPSDTPVDLEEFTSSSDLQALGLDRLKHALMARGLKCGGTLEERAVRLMTVKGLSPKDIQASHSALLAKSGGKGGKAKKSK